MKKLDYDNWPRKYQYEHYTGQPMYSLTTPIEVTKLYDYTKKLGISFYFSFGHLIHSVTKDIEEFNIRFRKGELYIDDCDLLSFCHLEPGETMMKFIGAKYCDDIVEFNKRVRETIQKQKQEKVEYKDIQFGEFFSCIPWFEVTAFRNPTSGKEFDFYPRVVWDKFKIVDGKRYVNLSIEVNHKLIDGYLLSRLIDGINSKINSLNM